MKINEKRALTVDILYLLSIYPRSHYISFLSSALNSHETTYNQPFQQNIIHYSLSSTMSSSTALTQYLWIAIAGVIFGFIYCFSIGANDVANAFVSLISLSLSICALHASLDTLLILCNYTLSSDSCLFNNRQHLLLLNQ